MEEYRRVRKCDQQQLCVVIVIPNHIQRWSNTQPYNLFIYVCFVSQKQKNKKNKKRQFNSSILFSIYNRILKWICSRWYSTYRAKLTLIAFLIIISKTKTTTTNTTKNYTMRQTYAWYSHDENLSNLLQEKRGTQKLYSQINGIKSSHPKLST